MPEGVGGGRSHVIAGGCSDRVPEHRLLDVKKFNFACGAAVMQGRGRGARDVAEEVPIGERVASQWGLWGSGGACLYLHPKWQSALYSLSL